MAEPRCSGSPSRMSSRRVKKVSSGSGSRSGPSLWTAITATGTAAVNRPRRSIARGGKPAGASAAAASVSAPASARSSAALSGSVFRRACPRAPVVAASTAV